MYVYIVSKQGPYPPLYTVGFYTPSGAWCPESDYNDRDEAAARVHYLNGEQASEDEPWSSYDEYRWRTT